MENEPPKKDVLLPASIIIAGVLISGSIFYLVGSKNNTPPSDNVPNEVVDASGVLKITGEDVILGDPNAPVAFFVYGDYQCPFCERMFQESEGNIRKDYIETGKVKMIYRNFPLDNIHPLARPAAEAAECAKDQGKFWLFHDALFERQASLASLDYPTLATELGLNGQTLKTCVNSGKYKDKIQKDLDGGIAVGVNGTPASFINGELVSGAQPYSAFKQIIEKKLQEAD